MAAYFAMTSKKACLITIFINGLFLLADQSLKWLALRNWQNSRLFFPHFGWEPYLNPGIAFSIRLPNYFIILATLPMVLLIAYLFHKDLKNNKLRTVFGWALALTGAVSNLIDRIVYHQVVDYFLIGWSIINIADIMIVAGLGLYLLSLRNQK